MAGKIDKEFLKKHHFWLLHGVIALGLVLAWFGLMVSVPDEISAKGEDNLKKKKALDAAKAQSRATLSEYDKRKLELFTLRGQRWKDMWEIQKEMYEWPAVLGEDQLAKVQGLTFGDNISNASLLEAFKTQLGKEYENLAKAIAPMQFNTGWPAVLRHVAAWRLTPESEEVWLALEDLWVQREIVQTIAKINEKAAKFDPLTPAEDPSKTRKRSFQNRTWKVDLEIVDAMGGYQLKGTIKNRTDRLQPYGANGGFVLKVWLSDDPNARPFEFLIQGSSLSARVVKTDAQGREINTEESDLKERNGIEPIRELPQQHKIYDGRVVGLYRVEQVFDARTLPVKRFDKLALGYTSARHSLADLEMTPFSTKAVEAETPAAVEGAPGAPGPGGPMAPPGGPMAPPGGPMAPPGAFGAGAGDAAAKGDMSPNLLVRRRYVNRTDQVRFMPIALSVVCDQIYSADVLTALANSRLRMQIVQSHLGRFRGTISYFGEGTTAAPDGPSASGTSPMAPGGPPPGPLSRPGPMGPPPPMGPGAFGGFPGLGSSSAPRSSSEDVASGNLIDFSVYGIASLYEKYQSEPRKDATAPAPVNPAPPAPAPVAPAVPAPVVPETPMPPAAPVNPAPAPAAPKL